MANAFERQIRLERGYRTAAFALGELQRRVRRESSILVKAGLSPRDVAETLAELESVFIVRLFSEFEASVRGVAHLLWPNTPLHRQPVRTVMDRLAARHHMVADVLEDAHSVRQLRNMIAHRISGAVGIPIGQCRSNLATFLSIFRDGCCFRPTEVPIKVSGRLWRFGRSAWFRRQCASL